MLFIILAVAWYVVGCTSFVCWWTGSCNLRSSHIPLMLFVGLCGPFAWLMGLTIHGGEHRSFIIKKARK